MAPLLGGLKPKGFTLNTTEIENLIEAAVLEISE